MSKFVIGNLEIELKDSKGRMDFKGAMAIFNKRKAINRADADLETRSKMKFLVSKGGDENTNVVNATRRDGTLVEAYNGGTLSKKIYNVEAVDMEAVARLTPVLAAAKDAEDAGDKALASDLYTYFLNRTQVSFSILSTNSLFNRNLRGEEIVAYVDLVKTENGTLLTLDGGSIVVKEASAGASVAGLATNPFAMLSKKAKTGGDGENVVRHAIVLPESEAATA